jgi:flagellar basal-body rod protein FlgG
LQGTNGNINVGDGGFAVDSEGNVTVEGASAGKIRLVSFNDLDGLRKEGSNLYVNYTNQRIYEDNTSTIVQGSLETSNVDITEEMVNMMQISRNYQLNQKMVTMIDESLEKSVNEVGWV